MDIFTLYVGQGALAAVRAGNEAVIVDAHMPECDDITPPQIERSLDCYLAKSNVRGLILTGLDRDHACPSGVESILTKYEPNWIMYPKCYKDTDAAGEVFDIITRHEKRREKTSRPLSRESVRVDRVESRPLTGLANYFTFELFSPHMADMDNSNNSSIVLKLIGLDQTAGYLEPPSQDTRGAVEQHADALAVGGDLRLRVARLQRARLRDQLLAALPKGAAERPVKPLPQLVDTRQFGVARRDDEFRGD